MMIINKILRVKTLYMQKCFIKHFDTYQQMLLAFFDTERQVAVICFQYIEACPKATILQKFSNSHFLKIYFDSNFNFKFVCKSQTDNKWSR